jgi:signal peptidase I
MGVQELDMTGHVQQPSGRFRPDRVLLRLMLGAIGLLVLSFTASAAARGFYVEGASMAPTLYQGQLLLVIEAAYWRLDGKYVFAGPRRGDVIVFRSQTAKYLVKRLIGLPGDEVRVHAGQVSVNGTLLDEPYVKFADDYTYPPDGIPRRVPENAYFVLGDNRPASADSHLGWYVESENMVGLALWPLPQGWLPYWSMPQPEPHREERLP